MKELLVRRLIMKVERLVFRSSNFVYVYHTGYEVNSLRFMGMTEQAYLSAKGTYRVLYCCEMNKTRDEMVDDVYYEFSLEKDVRNIDSKRPEDSIACIDEFLSEIKPMLLSKYTDDNNYSVLFRRGDYENGVIFSGLIYPSIHQVEGKLDLHKAEDVKLLGSVKNNSSMLTSQLPFRSNKVITAISHLKNLYMGDNYNATLMHILVSSDEKECIFSFSSVNVSDSVLTLLNKLSKHDKDYELSDYETVYFH